MSYYGTLDYAGPDTHLSGFIFKQIYRYCLELPNIIKITRSISYPRVSSVRKDIVRYLEHNMIIEC